MSETIESAAQGQASLDQNLSGSASTDVLAPPTKSYGHLNPEKVLTVHHWTDRLFSFTTTRDPSLRFENGQFAMIGLELDGKPLLRAYSIASANYEDQLEFLSIKVPDGPLTSQLCKVRPGDIVLVGRKPTGTLLVDNLRPGRTLFLLATGTGLAPFMSLIKDPAVYERFERVVLAHGVRTSGELAYANHIRHELPEHEFLGEDVSAKLRYYPTVTREEYQTVGRLTDLIESGKMFTDLDIPALDPEHDRVMICGSEAMLADLEAMLTARGFDEGNNAKPGAYVVEKAFAQK
ncbi:ferredoxin--NADP reductase [Rhizosaccharibacter radicis]|uniref:ferredoxin--NADP(+) reductase n=1 Tax=Rhizosaccharibacter radicis TaxID=2782605 RepID=A0ABT1W1P8_9PROT|nr:ferredoxin--NADP reductase [Acetobacteraceae bacterium KSS12]